MRGVICQKDGLFFFFSTISDTVESPVLPRAEFEAWYLYQTALDAKEELAPRIERAMAQGSSSREGESAYDVVRGNAERVSLKRILERRDRITGMDFATALGLLRAGVRVRRPGWDDRTWSIEDGVLKIRYPDPCGGEDASYPAYKLNEGDILTTDWEVAR